jgi:hypothetical protein
VPLEYQTWEGRYDYPDLLSTLYPASNVYGAWAEVLGRFRPHDDLVAALKDITDEDGDPAPIPAGRVPLSWPSNRRVAHALITGSSPTLAIPTPSAGSPPACPRSSFRCGATSTCPLRPVRTCADPGLR